MTQQTPRTLHGRRLLFHRRSRAVRSLATLGLTALTLGYAVPVASAARTFAEDRWVLDEVSVPTFAHPQLADDKGAEKGAKPDAAPDAARDQKADRADADRAAGQEKGDGGDAAVPAAG